MSSDPTRCNHIDCDRPKVPNGSHCEVHEPEWFAIERLQRDLIDRGYPPTATEVAELRARRDVMGMAWPPRNMPNIGSSTSEELAAIGWDIPVGKTVVRRRDIHGGGSNPPKYGGAWYGGIEPSSVTPNVFIFSEPEAGMRYGYNYDGWTPDGLLLYTGEGKLGDQRLTAGNLAIARHRADERSLRVFRANPPMATYLGEFAVASDRPLLWADAPDEEGNLRQVVIFRLRPVGDFVRADLPNAPPVGELEVATIPAEPEAPVAADVPPEVNKAEAFTAEPSAEPIEYQRREAALVNRYMTFLDAQGHTYGRKRIQIPDQAGRLWTDLHDQETDELIEAKATATRNSVRAGLGQLLDYARYVSHERKALLLPTQPRPDLIELLGAHGCGCIWEITAGRFERSEPEK